MDTAEEGQRCRQPAVTPAERRRFESRRLFSLNMPQPLILPIDAADDDAADYASYCADYAATPPATDDAAIEPPFRHLRQPAAIVADIYFSQLR